MSRQQVRVESSGKRVRVQHGGRWIADSTRALLVWENPPPFPFWWLPVDDLDVEVLGEHPRGMETAFGARGDLHDVLVGDRVAAEAAFVCTGGIDELRGHVRLDFYAMDAWFEEDERIHVHPRDPYTRIDCLRSSRHVRVEIDGVVVAESDQPTFLFETGLIRRTYLPLTHVRSELLVSSATRTACPYKGTAQYWSVRIGDSLHEDIAWYYPTPTLESAAIAGLVCFYDERVDVWIDGERQERPRSARRHS